MNKYDFFWEDFPGESLFSLNLEPQLKFAKLHLY